MSPRLLTYHPARIPIISNLTGARATDEQLGDPDYWVRHVRQAVRFADGVRTARSEGAQVFVELGPQGVLTALAEGILDEEEGAKLSFVATLRKGRDEAAVMVAALAELYSCGLAFDWPSFFAPHAPRRVALPTYAFQRERFWLEARRQRTADLAAAGQSAAEHPLLSAAVALADSDGFLLTGRLSLAEHPWLADHAVFGTPILPGTAFVEMALLAAERAGLDIEELTLEAPLALPPEGAVQLQLSVGASDGNGRRTLSVHARPEGAGEDTPWTRHASGLLGAGEEAVAFDLHQWPPAGAVPLPIEGLYEGLAAAGLSYGSTFQGLRAAWRLGENLFAEATLPDELAAEGFALHPALLDAALHALALGAGEGAPAIHLPFSWSGVSLRAVGATTLRVRLGRAQDGAVFLAVADATGEPVAAVEALASRPVSAEQLQGALGARRDPLYHLQWTPASLAAAKPATGVILGHGSADDPALSLERHADLAALQRSLEQGAPAPDLVVVALDGPPDFDPALAHKATADGLALLQAFVADDRLAASRLVLLTRRAVAIRPDEDVLDLAHAALWGLARTAQNENPDRSLFLVDSDGSEASSHALAAVLNANERQCALRNGQCLVPRLGRQSKDVLGLPDAPAWRLHIATRGSFDGLAFIPHPEAQAPLAAGQVRIAVQAAGLNFRDIVYSLGMLPGDDAPLGGEGAGIITELGPGVQEFAVGDRVMGLFAASFGPVAIADARLITLMPKAWSFAQGASVPITFVTAFYGLVDLAGLKAGERVLIHAAAGGVGTAAVQLARHLGAEVFATASRGKWHALQARDFDDAHLASSRDLDFERHFLRSTGQAGMDVVLDCLAGDFVDASLRLLPGGGRFLEMGKTDIRDAGEVAAAHPGVVYQAFDLIEAGPERLQEMLHELSVLFERGVLHPPPITCWDIRRAPQAFRALGRAQHIGKLVLTLPPSLDPQGTVLITGGTGTLGGLVARHLVTAHGVRHLLLISRQGPAAAGAEALRHELEAAGAEVTIVGCDASDREALRLLLEAIPAAQPLTAVFHAAGTLDDGMLPALTPERLDKVLAPKLDAAWHLHELTRDQDLAAFVLFSSLSGLFGAPGQANYAAANAFLDALSHHRQAQGLAASSLAWGYWSQASGLTGRLQATDIARMRRGGLLPLSSEQGLTLLDAALDRSEALVVPARFDLGVIAALGEPPALLRSLVHTRRTATNTAASSFAQRLLALPQSEREHALLDLVRREAATVLGLTSPSELDDRPPARGDRPRFPHGRRDPQPARRRHRTEAAGNPPLQPSDTGGAVAPSDDAVHRSRRGRSTSAATHSCRRRADCHRRDGLSLPGRRVDAGRAVVFVVRRRRCHLRLPRQPRLGSRRT